MARVWKVGQQTLYDDQIPFSPGSDEYYRYVAAWKARAQGVTLAPPKDYGDQWHRVGEHDQNNGRLNYYMDQFDAAKRQYAQGSETPEGYVQAMNPLTGQLEYFRDLNGDGQLNAGTENWGKYGGAGARNPAIQADNSWNDLDGVDVRTAEQKYYDRDTSNFQQVADAQGTYNWYADWEYRDKNGATQKKRINLDYLANRDGRDDSGKDQVGVGDAYSRDANAGFSGKQYWDYNGAPDKNFFDDQVRKRANMSIYGRTA